MAHGKHEGAVKDFDDALRPHKSSHARFKAAVKFFAKQLQSMPEETTEAEMDEAFDHFRANLGEMFTKIKNGVV